MGVRLLTKKHDDTYIFVVGAVVCTAIIAKYIWREKESFKTVYNDIKQELKQNINEGENY